MRRRDDPWRTARPRKQASGSRFTEQSLDLTFTKGIYQIRQIFWADVFGASSSDLRSDEQQRNRLNQLTTAAVSSVRRPGRKCSSGRETNFTSGMTGKMATDSRITRLSALTSAANELWHECVAVLECPFLSPQSDSNNRQNVSREINVVKCQINSSVIQHL